MHIELRKTSDGIGVDGPSGRQGKDAVRGSWKDIMFSGNDYIGVNGLSQSPHRTGKLNEDPDAKCLMSRLPREIMVRIIQYLDPVSDSIPLLACVCKKWRKVLLETPSLWRKLTVTPSTLDAHHYSALCASFITYGHHIQQLKWGPGTGVCEFIVDLLPSLSGLKVLNAPITWSRTFVERLSPLRNLEELTIRGCFELSDDDLILIAVQFPLLRKVTISSCWSISREGVASFMSCLNHLETCSIKINAGLPVEDARSDYAMMQGNMLARNLNTLPRVESLTSLVVNLIPIEMEELWSVVVSLPRLKKLTVCNCEKLYGVRISSQTLQRVTLFSLWSAAFVSITAPSLRRLRVDYGMESCEYLEVYSNKLKTMAIDGCGVLRLLAVQSRRLRAVELRDCPYLSPQDFQSFLAMNPTITDLILGDISPEETALESSWCPHLQSLTIQEDFRSRVLSVRCPTLEYFIVSEEAELTELETVIILSNHLRVVELSSVHSLRSLHVQCAILDSLTVNDHSDAMVPLRSCVIHAHRMVGSIRIRDCSVGALSISAPSVKELILYRCFLRNYIMQMALVGCSFIGHLGLEECLSVTQFHLPPSVGVRFLNLYGCQRLRLVSIGLPGLSALNLGQCFKASLTCDGKKIELNSEAPLMAGFSINLPSSSKRWRHNDVPPLPNKDGSGEKDRK